MRAQRAPISLILLLCLGCRDQDTDTGLESETGTETGPLADCTEALELWSDVDAVNIYRSVDFFGSGGTGAYRFTLEEPLHGATIDAQTGRLLAGGEFDVTLELRLEDEGCWGEAVATIEVLDAFAPAPIEGSIPSGTTFDFEGDHAVGELVCELVSSEAGSTLDGCSYTAGTEGIDIFRLLDSETQQSSSAVLEVDPDAQLSLRGEIWMMPLGSSLEPLADGGTGHLVLQIESGESISLVDEQVSAHTTGVTLLTVMDRFTGQSAAVRVVVSEPIHLELAAQGVGEDEGVLLDGFDWDGDGVEDIVIASSQLHLAGELSGGAVLFTGTASGLAEASWTWPGEAATGEVLGSSLAGGDVNGDGFPDLLVGSSSHSASAPDSGSLHLLMGTGEGLPEAADQALSGSEGSMLGSAVALCDLNGDTFADAISGVPGATSFDPSLGDIATGAIRFWPGDSEGLSSLSSEDRIGMSWSDEGWGPAELGLGTRILTEDLDADGLCDVVVSAPEAGVVLVFMGDSEDLLQEEPRLEIIGESGFGTALSLGSLDGDSLLWISQLEDSSGDVFGFSVSQVLAADGSLESAEALIQIGSSSASGRALSDAERSGESGLLISSDLPSDGGDGSVWWLPSSSISEGVFELESTGSLLYQGSEEDHLGIALGSRESGVLVLAPGRDDAGQDLGALLHIGADDSVESLAIPGIATGQGMGTSMAIGDGDGDGSSDLLLGTPELSDEVHGSGIGALWLCSGQLEAVCPEDTPPQRWELGWAPEDLSGSALATQLGRGDLDGDGVDEILVLFPGAEVTGDSSMDGGVVAVFSAGDLDTPVALLAGEIEDAQPSVMVSGMDFDGDGLQDLALANPSTLIENTVGSSVQIFAGQTLGGDTIGPSWSFMSHEPHDGMGTAMAAIADLDGDGCDELALGMPGANYEDYLDQGGVQILWGGSEDSDCGPPQLSSFAGRDGGAEAGAALAAGDLTGDGLADLAIGAPNTLYEASYRGQIFLLSGETILESTRFEIQSGEMLPSEEDIESKLLLPEHDGWVLVGENMDGHLGQSLVSIEDWNDPARSLVVVGLPGPQGVEGSQGSGGAWVLGFDDDANQLDPSPRGLLAGEVDGEGALGQVVVDGSSDGKIRLLVGAPHSDAQNFDGGAVYVFELEAP